MSEMGTKINVDIIWKDEEKREETVTCCVGQWDGVSDDSDIFYWFDDWDKIVGDHPDFIVQKYKEGNNGEYGIR